MKICEFLVENNNTSLSKIIFFIRSQTLDIKQWQPWKNEDNLCLKCSVFAETMDHFVSCSGYGTETKNDWRDIFDNDCEKQQEIGRY